jgi:hydroxymethylpyrimidine pyrophosphatase-like HAD family hydrolase
VKGAFGSGGWRRTNERIVEEVRFFALAADYDETLAHDGRVEPATVEALHTVVASGRRLVLVTGRELPELLRLFPEIHLFARVVAENGALLYDPASREQRLLTEPADPRFVARLRARGVPMSVGRAIVAARQPHETEVLETIRELGLELQVIFNKGAVMVLPSGVNKASGLGAALDELELSPHNVVGVGDAENDHAFLRLCSCSVAVANALPSLKAEVDVVTEGEHGAGVREVAERLLVSDLRDVAGHRDRISAPLAWTRDGAPLPFGPETPGVLIVGPPGAGKTTLIASLLEGLTTAGYQFCYVDPEGEHASLAGAVTIGDATREPAPTEILELLESPRENVIVNLRAAPATDRPRFVASLLPRIFELRGRVGRPHFIVFEEAHQVLAAAHDVNTPALPDRAPGMVFVTARPDRLALDVIRQIGDVLAIGEDAGASLHAVAALTGDRPPIAWDAPLRPGEAMAWRRTAGQAPFPVQRPLPRAERRRHRYAPGDMGEEGTELRSHEL